MAMTSGFWWFVVWKVLAISISINAFSSFHPTLFQKRAAPTARRRAQTTTLNALFRKRSSKKSSADEESVDGKKSVPLVTIAPPDISSAVTTKPKRKNKKKATETASICVIGGGLSGLAAALTAAEAMAKSEKHARIILLEASDTLGGRLQSDKDDGFVLDRGFAVFIEEYPVLRELLDYDALKLGKFSPGALVKIQNRTQLALVTDPLRKPENIVEAILAPVGSLLDKIRLLPLIFHVRERTVDDLFREEEVDTLIALKVRWEFSELMLDRFFRPFLEGIFLAPLTEQSSRMFLFLFKMFTEGSAALPEGGMGAVAKQLADKAKGAGVDLRVGNVVTEISINEDGFLVQTGEKSAIQAKSVVLATDGRVAQKFISQLDGFDSLGTLVEQPQRSVGCLYYSFEGPAPVTDPILILNGIGKNRGNAENPVNNACFPSVVSKGYAPEGSNLCSVTVLKDAMELYRGKEDELDKAVRQQLSSWFPAFKNDILQNWKLRRIYNIPNAQPQQLYGPWPANVNRGRKCTRFRGFDLPKGLVICGDHMATPTFNGALESGLAAGVEAAIRAAQ